MSECYEFKIIALFNLFNLFNALNDDGINVTHSIMLYEDEA